MSVPLSFVRTAASLPGLMRDLEQAASREPTPLLVTGPPSVARPLAAALAQDGESAFVQVLPAAGLGSDTLAGGTVLVHVLAGRLTPTDERLLGEARRAGLQVVCLALGTDALDARLLGLVRARDIVLADAVGPAAVEAVAGRVAAGAGDEGWLLARRLPALRRPVARALAGRQAFAGAVLTAGRPGSWQETFAADLRLGLRVAAGHGKVSDRRVALVVGSIAAAAVVARLAVDRRGGSRALDIAIAFAGSWAAGRAAAAYCEHGR